MRLFHVKHPWLLFLVLVLALSPAAPGWSQEEGGQDEQDKNDKKEAKAEEKKKKDLPLEPARDIQFTTDEATWLSLDVTPDGKTIVFELLGDLYTLPIEGGAASRGSGGNSPK